MPPFLSPWTFLPLDFERGGLPKVRKVKVRVASTVAISATLPVSYPRKTSEMVKFEKTRWKKSSKPPVKHC